MPESGNGGGKEGAGWRGEHCHTVREKCRERESKTRREDERECDERETLNTKQRMHVGPTSARPT